MYRQSTTLLCTFQTKNPIFTSPYAVTITLQYCNNYYNIIYGLLAVENCVKETYSMYINLNNPKCISSLQQNVIAQGFTVIASFEGKNDKALKLKEESSGRLHTIQLDISSETQILEAVRYVKEHIPQGK